MINLLLVLAIRLIMFIVFSNRTDEAVAVIRKYHNSQDVQEELEAMSAAKNSSQVR